MSAVAPDIAGLLASLGGEAQGGPQGMMGGPPQGPPEEASREPTSVLKDLISVIQEYLAVERDEEDKLQGTKLLQLAQQLLAKNQQDMDSALGGSNARILRKAT